MSMVTANPTRTDRMPLLVTAGLFLAWCVHDAEELATVGATTSEVSDRLPSAVAERLASTTPGEFAVAVALVGVVMAVAAADGIRTRGRGFLFQLGVLGFGVHGVGHIASAVLLGAYTPGVVTSVVVVVPYSVAAVLWLRRRGLTDGRRLLTAAVVGALLFVPVVALARLAASFLVG
ncbi:HXXEE domain-containing protein [Actinoplanes rectilineatus]|uniref:HXXEE domain-containing protein n=1 Tax=Actinoplanes rectilineatus TaxID=113571 RepID=UPI0006991B2C|nr:HXXEE domain-containing protein [Actinoplanes rectilineatus]